MWINPLTVYTLLKGVFVCCQKVKNLVVEVSEATYVDFVDREVVGILFVVLILLVLLLIGVWRYFCTLLKRVCVCGVCVFVCL